MQKRDRILAGPLRQTGQIGHRLIAEQGPALGGRTVDGEIVSFNCIVPAFMVKKGQLEDDLGPRLVAMVRNIEANLGLH